MRYVARLNFTKPDPSNNNTIEYEALLLGLCKMKALGHQNFIVKSDSKVISDHIEKEFGAQNPELINYLETVRAMEKHFNGFSIEHIPRPKNSKADKLARAAARKQPLPPDVFYEEKPHQCHPQQRLEISNNALSLILSQLMKHMRKE